MARVLPLSGARPGRVSSCTWGVRSPSRVNAVTKLLAIASWDSKVSRDAMEADPSEEVRRIIAGQAEFVDVRVLGEFEDPDWVVLPD